MSQPFHDHFSRVANRYADFRPTYPPALFQYLATLVPPHAIVWDCAAGNGQASVGLAQRFDRVIATDASREQIGSAQPNPRIDFRVAPAEASGLPNQAVELVTVAQALHWFKLEQFYAEVRRVLKPDGVLAVWAYGVTQIEGEAVNRLVDDYYTNIVGPYWPPERRLVEEGYRTIPFPFSEISAPSVRMETRWTPEQLLGYLSTWSATNRYIQATGHNPLEELAPSLATAWGDASRPRLVAWPLSLRVGRELRKSDRSD